MLKYIQYFFNWMTSLGGRADTGTQRFFRYSVAGGNTFLLDLFLLWILNSLLFIHYVPAAIGSYLFSTLVHYYIVRRWAFRKTERKAFTGYILFMAILISGLLINIGLLAMFVEIFGTTVLVGRLLSGVFVGLWNYLLNHFLNFKTSGAPL